MRSKFWLFADWCITSPFLLLGYILSAANSAIRRGWHSYEYNYFRAKSGKL